MGLDASEPRDPAEKAGVLRSGGVKQVSQQAQLCNPDARVTLERMELTSLLSSKAVAYQGVKTGDDPRYRRSHWELARITGCWRLYQSTVEKTSLFGGADSVLDWSDDGNAMARRQGLGALGRAGAAVSQMQSLPCALYLGHLFDSNVAPVVPRDPSHLHAVWAFCSSAEYSRAVRRIDQKLNVANATLVKVPFNLVHWQAVADATYPNGLPEPHSNDPTQWLFEGHPAGSTDPLQIAVARLLGYRWPRQTDRWAEISRPPRATPRAAECGNSALTAESHTDNRLPVVPATPADGLEPFADPDGIVCLPAVGGEQPAEERLRSLLAAAFGQDWSPGAQDRLLAEAGSPGKGLGEWLRDDFFTQHCKLFHNRPFIWHIWDGRKDGFSALVNYHTLDARKLDRLIYTVLGSWIVAMREATERGEAGADARLVAALALQDKLKLIAQGDPPYDIYVRWKPLADQPIGWNPDLNDGVRLNIRPFVTAGVLRSKFSINWNKDRGTNPDGSVRLNDLHFTRAQKEAARRERSREKGDGTLSACPGSPDLD